MNLQLETPKFMKKVYSRMEKKYVQVINSPLVSNPWTSSRNKKNSIEKSHHQKWTLPCTFMHSQIGFLEVMKNVYSGKDKNTCKL